MTCNIEFSTSDKDILEMFPVLPASKVIPEWYKEMPIEIPEIEPYTKPHTPSIKRCMPVLDYMTTGYVIRATYEVNIKQYIDEKFFAGFDFKCRHTDNYIGKHPWHQAQFKAEDGKKHHYLKINQPWHITTPSGYSCMLFDPYYRFRKEYSIFPGVVDTDKHNEPIGLVGIIKEANFSIKPGDPLVVVFPFKREDWKMTLTERTDEWERSSYKYRLSTYWAGIYQRLMHTKKSFK